MIFLRSLLFLMVFYTAGAFAESCPQADMTSMTWSQRFQIYKKIINIKDVHQQQGCLLQYFYSIRDDFYQETLKGEQSYEAFFEKMREEFNVDNEIAYDRVAPMIVFFQQVWMEEALDRWLDHKSRDINYGTYAVGFGVVALMVGFAAWSPTRKMTHRPLKPMMRVFKQMLLRGKVFGYAVPSVFQMYHSEDSVMQRYKGGPSKYVLPKSPFELTENWLSNKQNILLDPEEDQFWSDFMGMSAGAASGSLSGMAVTALSKKFLTSHKGANLFLGVLTTMIVTAEVERTTSDYLAAKDFEKVISKVSETIYEVKQKLKEQKTIEAYLQLYGLVNEIEIYSLLKLKDFSLTLDDVQKKAIASCLPPWTEEEIQQQAKKTKAKAQLQFRYARTLIDHFHSETKALVTEKFPYFQTRLQRVEKFMDLISSEKDISSVINQAIVDKNECYKP